MAQKVFISYRRGTTAGFAGRLFDMMIESFDRESIFMDTDKIDPGEDFVRKVKSEIAISAVLLALISKEWVDIRDPNGNRRLDNHDDTVNLEIRTALEQGVCVVPVLVGETSMPDEEELPESIKALAKRNAMRLIGEHWEYYSGLIVDFISKTVDMSQASNTDSCGPGLSETFQADLTRNPFFERRAITDADFFFSRQKELRRLKNYLVGRQNCQIIAPRRMGKSSLLNRLSRLANEWDPGSRVAHIDLQDPRCTTLKGWLHSVARQLSWDSDPQDLGQFTDFIEEMIRQGMHPVLCLDDFSELLVRGDEFSRDFFLTLRYCGQRGASIFTTSQLPLSELTDPDDQTSQFFNTFPLLRMGIFPDKDVMDFLNLHREGVRPFTESERRAIIEFSRGHPLALQVCCFHTLDTSSNEESLEVALQRSQEDMHAFISSW